MPIAERDGPRRCERFSGRRVPEYDMEQIREIFEGPYRIVYYIKPDQIDVLAVIHGARDVLSGT